MNTYFLVSAILTFLMALSHSVLGERFFLIRLFKRETPENIGNEQFLNRTTRTAWHLTAIAWCGIAAILVVLSFRSLDSTGIVISKIISVLFLISGLVSIIGSHGRHLSWIIFLLISLLVWLGVY